MSQRLLKTADTLCCGLVLLTVLTAGGCSQSDSQPPPKTVGVEEVDSGQTETPTVDAPETRDYNGDENAESNPEVIIKTSFGDITVRLDAQKAPITVANFLKEYVARDHYSRTIFHYIEPGKTVMGGGYTEDLTLKETRAQITSEADNGLKNLRGTIAMARSPDHAHSATSQFFFNLCDNPSFDYVGRDTPEDFGYCVFGQVVSGMDVLDKIGQLEVQDTPKFPSFPQATVRIESVERVR